MAKEEEKKPEESLINRLAPGIKDLVEKKEAEEQKLYKTEWERKEGLQACWNACEPGCERNPASCQTCLGACRKKWDDL